MTTQETTRNAGYEVLYYTGQAVESKEKHERNEGTKRPDQSTMGSAATKRRAAPQGVIVRRLCKTGQDDSAEGTELV